MPPWHIDKTIGVQQFKNDTSLTDEQIKTIARWVDSGAPDSQRTSVSRANDFGASHLLTGRAHIFDIVRV
jgi:hypothetical protein